MVNTNVLHELSQKDIIKISKICQITNVFSKQTKDLITEIDRVKSPIFKEPVREYFIQENIIPSLYCHNREMHMNLNINNYFDNNVLSGYKQKVIKNNFYPVPKYMMFGKHNVLKFCYQNDPNMTKEWFMNTYVIPFIFYCNLSFNILLPETTGVVQIKYMKNHPSLKDVLAKTLLHPKDEEMFSFIVSPFIKNSLIELVYHNTTNNEDYYYIFQVIYTLACFGKLGLMHNDVHCGNIRVKNINPRDVRFVIDNTTFYDVKVDKELLIYDFDLSSVDGFIKDVTKKYGIVLQTYNNVSNSPLMSLEKDEGRRDMLIFLIRYLFVYYDRTQYLVNKETRNNQKAVYLKKLINENIENSKQIYNNLINLIIDITRGKIKEYFIAIKDNKIFPYDKHPLGLSSSEINTRDEFWVQSLLYRQYVPECPLKTKVTKTECMSPLEVLKSPIFKNFVGFSNKINKHHIRPTTEVSLDINDHFMNNEYSRFMKEYFNV